ncbi:trypsin-like serine peptidase [Thiohalocapsa halophila]|nr:serine protease [Thiohalocapsa halophila]
MAGFTMPAFTGPSTSQDGATVTREALELRLSPLTHDQALARIAAATEATGGALRLGFGREIPADQLPAPDALPWRRTDDGRHALTLILRAPDARGLRVALRPQHLPDTAELRFSGPGSAARHTLDGALVNASLAADAAAGPDAPLFWSPLIAGDALLLEITLPAGADPHPARLGLPAVSHLARLPGEPPADAAATAEATDPACHPDWDRQSRAATLLLYTHPHGATGACTGTLVADDDSATDIPYVLTAQHCFPDQGRASSIEGFWFLRAETCGGPVGAGDSVPGGADVLYLAQSTDTALLRLRQPPPADAAFVHAQPILPAIGLKTSTLHHPFAGPQELGRATVSEYKTCIEVDWCGEDADPAAIGYVRVERRSGATEPGSSGAGLFNAERRLLGTNLGGSAAGEFEYYGRFDAPYRDGVRRWLGDGVEGSGRVER